MSFPPAVVDHASAAVARLAQWAKDRPNILHLLNAANTASQLLETALQDLIAKRYLAVAANDQLDQIGKIVGQARNGDDDTTYRQRIRVRVKINRSSGTVPEVLAIMRLALISISPVANSIRLDQEQNASFLLMIVEQQTPALASVMRSFLEQSRDAGVRAVLGWIESAPANVFTLDVGPGLDQGHLAGGATA